MGTVSITPSFPTVATMKGTRMVLTEINWLIESKEDASPRRLVCETEQAGPAGWMQLVDAADGCIMATELYPNTHSLFLLDEKSVIFTPWQRKWNCDL